MLTLLLLIAFGVIFLVRVVFHMITYKKVAVVQPIVVTTATVAPAPASAPTPKSSSGKSLSWIPKLLIAVAIFWLLFSSTAQRVIWPVVQTAFDKFMGWQPPAPPPPPLVVNYGGNPCPDAWQHDIQEPEGNQFTVTLHEGCFGNFVTFPKGWSGGKEWHYQPVGDDAGWWFSIWFTGAHRPESIYDQSATPHFDYHPTTFRLQGKEGQEIRFYISDVNAAGAMEPTPPDTPLFTPTGYEERFCSTTAENEGDDFSNRYVPDFSVELHVGCFAGPFVLPRKGWRTWSIDKSQGSTDWAAVWCDGKSKPSPIRPFYADFKPEDFKGCTSFYLQGKGDAILKGLSR